MTSETPSAPAATRSRGVTIALWIGQVVLALNFASAAFNKLTAEASQVEMFGIIGLGIWLMYFVGVCEAAGTVGVLIPRLSGLAALGLVIVMIGATFANLFLLPVKAMALLSGGLGIVAGLVAWGRWPETKSLAAMVKR